MVGSNVLNSQPNNYLHLKGKPHWKRTIAVYTALDNAPIHYSYSQLMKWVKKETGKKCSRKLISKWKLEKTTANSKQLSVIKSSGNNHQEESSIISHNLSVVNEESFMKSEVRSQKSEVNSFCLLPFAFCLPEGRLPAINTPLSSCVCGLKQVGKIAALTVMFLGANFIFTPQDVTVKLAIAEPQDNSLTTKLTTNLTPQPKPKTGSPNRIKINLTITDPSDLKVKPGDEVTKGQIISDRTTERQRLLNQRKQLQLSLKKLTIAIPQIQAPQPISKLPNLPPISYQQQQANIALKEQELKEAAQAVNNQEKKIDSLRQLGNRRWKQRKLSVKPSVNSPHVEVSSNINTKFDYVDLNGQPVNPNQKVLTIHPSKTTTNQTTVTIKPTVNTNTTTQPSPNKKLLAILEHETAILNQLKGNEEKAKRELQISKSQLETAKEQRRYAEHQHYLENNRRAIALQQQQLELERQRTIRAGQLQEQEYSKTQIEAKIIEIDNAINQLSTVKIPYNGTIKKVKWTGQTDHTLTVTVTLDVDEPSTSSDNTDE